MKFDDLFSDDQMELLKTIDVDGDGTPDLYLYDSNHDGKTDIIGIDNDGDQIIDSFAIDSDYNGTFETFVDDIQFDPAQHGALNKTDGDDDLENLQSATDTEQSSKGFFSSILSPNSENVQGGLAACSYKCIMSYCYPVDIAKGIDTKHPHPSNSKVGHTHR